jgi:general stress protein YciG
MAEEKRERGRQGKGEMTVSEAGHRGGERTAETHGREFYEDIGHKGGQRAKELVEEGKEHEIESESRSTGRSSRSSYQER